MLVEALIGELEQRFLYEKRAQVCLWFDEREEFRALLPALQIGLAGRERPPFTLLTYEAQANRGQIWVKYEIHQRLSAAVSDKERREARFVVYLPFGEDRLEAPQGDDGVRLDLLEEYRTAGVIWRIGGKRPTLFSFLRAAGVPLPEIPADQRRLWEGGPESLLAKYAGKFVDRPAAFWARQLTPEWVQSQLVGDADQTILELAVDPETTGKALKEGGLDREFLAVVRERYGFDASFGDPAAWVQELVTVLALTEAFLGYGEPSGFPFMDRLPAIAVRAHHRQLLQRWLRDAEYRVAWDRWIGIVETKIDLTKWAKGRRGLSFAFPHLSRLRLREILDSFEEASAKESATESFFTLHSEVITRETELAKATSDGAAAWSLLTDLRQFLRDAYEATERAKSASSASDLAGIYVDCAYRVEWRHVELRHRADAEGLGAAARVADRAYASYALALNDAFFQRIAAVSNLELPGIPGVTAHLDLALWRAKGRRAVVVVDALRYDCALAIKAFLRRNDVEVKPLLARLPTVTPVGMTALLPVGDRPIAVEVKALHPRVDGKDLSVRENRLELLRTFGADCLEIGAVEATSDAPAGLRDLLAVYGHDDVDQIGHGQGASLIRHLHVEIERLGRLIRKLHRWGYGTVHLVTDHGFILLDERKLPPEIVCDKDWCLLLKERFAIVPAAADLPLVCFSFPWDPQMKVAVPPGLAFFKAEKSFSHGGAAVQELVIPHLISHGAEALERRIGVEVVLPAYDLQRTSVKVILRPAPPAGAPSGQMSFAVEVGRTLALDVVRRGPGGEAASVLAGKPKEVRLEPAVSGQDVSSGRPSEQSVVLFFHSAARFQKGEILELEIRDVETLEQFPPGGIKLTAGRDM